MDENTSEEEDHFAKVIELHMFTKCIDWYEKQGIEANLLSLMLLRKIKNFSMKKVMDSYKQTKTKISTYFFKNNFTIYK